MTSRWLFGWTIVAALSMHRAEALAPVPAMDAAKPLLVAAPAGPADPRKRAAGCEVPRFRFGGNGLASMSLKNDGNWCWIDMRSGRTSGPFTVVQASTPPAHGSFETAPSPNGDTSRLYYRPAAGYTGSDQFVVDLQPGNGVLTVNVTVK